MNMSKIRRYSKALSWGILVGISGVLISLLPTSHSIEEGMGLKILFKIRGTSVPPRDVVVVSLDRESASQLNLPIETRKWPHSIHAKLIDSLKKIGVAVIVFDMLFNESDLPANDLIFAQSIKNAGNVVLCEYLEKGQVPLESKLGSPTGTLNIERIIPPIQPIADAAIALAPFPLPKIPVRLSRYWAFKEGAGDVPTLPVVAFNVFALNVYEEFLLLLKTTAPSHADIILPDNHTILKNKSFEESIVALRNIFKTDPSLAMKMIAAIQRIDFTPKVDIKKQIMIGLVYLLSGPDSSFLNLYGPPGTIETVSYHRVMENVHRPGTDYNQFNLQGKAIFIGLSENLRLEQKDGFHTVFSQSNGIDISGVEIAATVYANLLENSSINPLRFPQRHATLLLWGSAVGMLCVLLKPIVAAIGLICLSILYLGISVHLFGVYEIWSPVTIPLFFQIPFGFVSVVIWKLFGTEKERLHTRKAMEKYVRVEMIDQLVRNSEDIDAGSKIVYGACLFSDAKQYTAIAEKLMPGELKDFMNSYYEEIFKPVKCYKGWVSDVEGDAMLSIWESPQRDPGFRTRACLAALDISKAVNKFKDRANTVSLPTRIGLHAGKVCMANIGAHDHYEYRAVGDTVNTASRIEKLNKHLNTHILTSKHAICGLDGLLTRKVGDFKLFGKSNPITIYELISRQEESTSQLENMCSHFSTGLKAYAEQCWEDALTIFCEVLKICKEDGPSSYYKKKCEYYIKKPPGEILNGLICMEEK
jgi:adenylate cyclase